MKIVVILLVLAALAIGGAFLFKSNSETGSGIENVYILAVLGSSVLVKSEDQSEFTEITKSLQVKTGDEIKTSSNGRAALLYPNGNITNLDHDSHLKIKNLDESGDKSVLTLLTGGMLAKVRHVLGTSDYYKIETQNSVASVRGTIFAVKFKEKKSSVLVLENQVLVSALNPETGETLLEGMVEVGSGEKVKIDSEHLPSKDYPLETETLTQEDLSDELIKENLDKEDLEEEQVREIFKKLDELMPSREPSLDFDNFVSEELETTREPEEVKVEKRKGTTPTPTPTPSLSKTPSPVPFLRSTPKPSEKPKETEQPTPTPTPPPTLIISSTPTPIPTPTPIKTSISSITPQTVDVSENKKEVVINGRKLTGTKRVLVGDKEVKFFALDELSIFVTIPAGFSSGTYDVSIVTSMGESLRLEGVLTVQVYLKL